MSELSIEKVILEAEPNLTTHLVKKALESTLCPVCQDHMFVPFMTKCGHNFCYECITSWIQTNQTCPSCRTDIVQEPYLNVHLQDMVNSLVDTSSQISTLSADVLKDRDLKIKYYKKDVSTNNTFKRIFKNTGHAVIDSSDGVARCSNCHWEVHGNRCPNCHIRLRNSYIDEISSADTEFEMDDFANSHLNPMMWEDDSSDDEFHVGSEPDEDDEDFIDDRELGELEIEDHDPVLTDEDSRDSSPVRQPRRRYVPTFIDEDEPWEDQPSDSEGEFEDWNGFQDERNGGRDVNIQEHVLSNMLSPLIEQYINRVFLRGEADEDDDEDCLSPRRRRAIIRDSDDDDDEIGEDS